MHDKKKINGKKIVKSEAHERKKERDVLVCVGKLVEDVYLYKRNG